MRKVARTVGFVIALLGVASDACHPGRTLTPSSRAATSSLLGLAQDSYSFLVVVAHPDDETEYLSGALTSLVHGEGLKGAVLCLTSGAKGGNRNGWEMDAELEQIRERELLNAARSYGVDVLFARFQDYGEARTVPQIFEESWDREASLALVTGVVRALRPTMIVSMHPQQAPDSPAHRAASELADEARKLAAAPAYRPDLGAAWSVERHVYGAGEPLGTRADFRVNVQRYADVHARAARAHESQIDPKTINPPDSFEAGLLHGKLTHTANTLIAGLPPAALPKRPIVASFEPDAHRLYESPLGREVQLRQQRRHEAYLQRLGAYSFRFSEPAEIAKASAPIRVDGELSEFAAAKPVQLRRAEQELATVRLLWHRDGLAIGAEILEGGAPENNQPLNELYRGDCVELYLNARPDDAFTTRAWRNTWDRQYIFAPSHAGGGPIAAGASKTFALSNTRVEARTTANGYVLEAWMAASEFAAWPPPPGAHLRLDVGVNIERRRARWHDTTGNGWFNPHEWGLAKISDSSRR